MYGGINNLKDDLHLIIICTEVNAEFNTALTYYYYNRISEYNIIVLLYSVLDGRRYQYIIIMIIII